MRQARTRPPAPATPRRSSRARERATDGWSWSNIGQWAVIIGGIASAGFGGYMSLQGRLAAHDTDIAKLSLRIDSDDRFVSELRGSLNTISQQISDLRTAIAGHGKTR